MVTNLKKLEAVVLLLAKHPKVKNLGKTKLYKLAYFADVTHLREFGATITGSEYIKYPYGPVPSRAEKVLRTLKSLNQIDMQRRVMSGEREIEEIVSKSNTVPANLSESELTTLDQVASRLGGKTAKYLSDLSHKEPAWCYADMKDKLDFELMAYGYEEDPHGL